MTAMTTRRAAPRPRRPAQRGAVAIMVGVALTVLVGAVGLSIDAGRLYVTKSELQSAVDACALAAARELVCTGTSDTSCLDNARAAGQTVAARHKANLQASTVSATVTFASTLSGTYASNAPAAARHVRCTAQVSGIVPWLMGVLGAGSSTVAASAVGTITQSFCLSTPMALCRKVDNTNFGYTTTQWISATSKQTGSKNDLSANMRWASITGSTDTQAIRDQLMSSTASCGKTEGSVVTLVSGGQQDAQDAYNSRFGIYPKSNGSPITLQTAPPDPTGYAYPAKAPKIAIDTDVLSNYLTKRTGFTPFDNANYDGNSPISGNSATISTTTDLKTNGRNRRLITVPVIDCTASTPKLLGSACLLMLNPMAAGKDSTLYFQFLGNAASGTTSCSTVGTAGGSVGQPVVVLAQ